jgi:hypothetical protein
MAQITIDLPEGVEVPEGYSVIPIPYPADKEASIMAAIAESFGGIQDGVSSEVFAIRGLQGFIQRIYTAYLKNQASLNAIAFVQEQEWEGIVDVNA